MKNLSEKNRKKLRELSAKRYRERRILIDKIKIESGCIDCPYDENPAALQFDHRNPKDKLFRISTSWGVSMVRLMAEIAKCDIRCANCHAVRTDKMRKSGEIKFRIPMGMSEESDSNYLFRKRKIAKKYRDKDRTKYNTYMRELMRKRKLPC